MNLDTFVLADVWPAVLELALHLSPDPNTVGSQLLKLLLSLILKLPESVALLNLSGLDHEEFELLKVAESFIVTPCLLDHDGCHDRSTRTLEHLLWILNNGKNLTLVADC